MNKFLIAVSIAALSACSATDEPPIVGPSGKTVSRTKCSDAPDQCFVAANAACGGSYQVVDSSSNAGGLIDDASPGPTTWYHMSYMCGPSDGQMPSFAFRGPQYTPPTTTTCRDGGRSVTCTTY